MTGFFLAILVGTLLPAQSAINSKLRSFVISPLFASMISSIIATIFLIALAIIFDVKILPTREDFEIAPLWSWLGGFLGVIGLTALILLFRVLGSIQTVILPIMGQIFMGLLTDNFGLFEAPIKQITFLRGIGVLILIVGVVMIVVIPALKNKSEQKNSSQNIFLWQIAGILTGMSIATQSAVNGHLGKILNSTITTAEISFFVCSLVLIIYVFLVEKDFSKIKFAFGSEKPIWIWFGGILGALLVVGNAYLVPEIGAGGLVIFSLFGQMVSSLIIDFYGLFGAIRRKILKVQIFGMAVMIIGVILIEL